MIAWASLKSVRDRVFIRGIVGIVGYLVYLYVGFDQILPMDVTLCQLYASAALRLSVTSNFYSASGKAFARIVLTRVKDILVQSRRIQQSGFTRGRSTIDRIATLNMLHQTRREFSQPLWAAYVDLVWVHAGCDRSLEMD